MELSYYFINIHKLSFACKKLVDIQINIKYCLETPVVLSNHGKNNNAIIVKAQDLLKN